MRIWAHIWAPIPGYGEHHWVGHWRQCGQVSLRVGVRFGEDLEEMRRGYNIVTHPVAQPNENCMFFHLGCIMHILLYKYEQHTKLHRLNFLPSSNLTQTWKIRIHICHFPNCLTMIVFHIYALFWTVISVVFAQILWLSNQHDCWLNPTFWYFGWYY